MFLGYFFSEIRFPDLVAGLSNMAERSHIEYNWFLKKSFEPDDHIKLLLQVIFKQKKVHQILWLKPN